MSLSLEPGGPISKHGFFLELQAVSIKHLADLLFNKGSAVHRTLVSLYANILELTDSATITLSSA